MQASTIAALASCDQIDLHASRLSRAKAHDIAIIQPDFSALAAPPNPAAPPQLSEAQHNDLLEQFLRQELSICGLAARFDLSPADIARWTNSPRTLADLAEIDIAMRTRGHFHSLASRTAAQQLLTQLCYTRGRPEHLDPGDQLNDDDHKSLDRARKSATSLLRASGSGNTSSGTGVPPVISRTAGSNSTHTPTPTSPSFSSPASGARSLLEAQRGSASKPLVSTSYSSPAPWADDPSTLQLPNTPPLPSTMPGLFAGTPLEQPVTCERCNKTHAQCTCPRGTDGKVLDPKTQHLRVRREKRRGKMVTVVAGLAPRSQRTDDLPTLLATLKKKHATGGTIGGTPNEPELELQGDHRDALVKYLLTLGYPAKPSGG